MSRYHEGQTDDSCLCGCDFQCRLYPKFTELSKWKARNRSEALLADFLVAFVESCPLTPEDWHGMTWYSGISRYIYISRYRLGRDLARTKMPGPSWWNVMKSPKLSETQRFSGKFRLKRENGFGLRYRSFSFFGPWDIANTTTWQIGWSLWLWLNCCCDFLQYGIWTELDTKIGRFSLI